MPDPDRFVARLRRRLFVGEAFHAAAAPLAAFLVALGLALLAAKLFAPRQLPIVYWSSLAVAPLLAFVAWRASRRMPSDRDAIAVLDARMAAGGLLMTLSERRDPRWRPMLPPAERWAAAVPKVRPVRFARAMAAPALFAAAVGFIPPRAEPPPAPKVAAGVDAAKELAETFELLDKAAVLDEDTKAALSQELDDLAADAVDKPLTHEKWETVDALSERMRSSLDAADLAVSKGRSAAAVLGASTSAGQPLSAERSEGLSEELARAVETLRKNGAFSRSAVENLAGMPPEVQQLLKEGEFRLPTDPAARQEALDQLAQLLDAEQKRLAEARGQTASVLGGLLSPDDLFAQLETQLAGLGGRGGEVAELNFGKEPDEQAAKFKEAVLPPGFLDSPNDETAGVTASAPRVDAAGPAPRNAARDPNSTKGGATWDRPLRPRHRDVVRRYFDDG